MISTSRSKLGVKLDHTYEPKKSVFSKDYNLLLYYIFDWMTFTLVQIVLPPRWRSRSSQIGAKRSQRVVSAPQTSGDFYSTRASWDMERLPTSAVFDELILEKSMTALPMLLFMVLWYISTVYVFQGHILYLCKPELYNPSR